MLDLPEVVPEPELALPPVVCALDGAANSKDMATAPISRAMYLRLAVGNSQIGKSMSPETAFRRHQALLVLVALAAGLDVLLMGAAAR